MNTTSDSKYRAFAGAQQQKEGDKKKKEEDERKEEAGGERSTHSNAPTR